MSRLPQNLTAPLNLLAQQAVGKDWQLYSILLRHWRDIIGADWAEKTAPVRIVFPQRQARRQGVLTISLPRGLSMEMQYRQPQILARLNGFLGHEAIMRLHFLHGTPRTASPPVSPRSLSAGETAWVGAAVAHVADAELRASLEQFGLSLLAAQGAPKEEYKP